MTRLGLSPAPIFLAGLTVIAASGLAGCGESRTLVPPGGQEVHVVVAGSEVSLRPATVRAGDIYLVLDVPMSGVILVQRKATAEETPGPLTDAELARLATGDTFHTQMTGGFGTGEPRGNVHKVALSAGRYAFLTDDPVLLADRAGGVIPPAWMAILEVLP
jgi:hypothetical protein